MADQLYLSLWYPNFRLAALAPATLGVLRQFALIGSVSSNPSRADSNGVPTGAPLIRAASVYPIDWSETPVYERIYDLDPTRKGVTSEFLEDEIIAADPVHAVPPAFELLHDDFAYEFEIAWDLWQPDGTGLDGDRDPQNDLDPLWSRQPARVRVVAFGPEFDEGTYETGGQIRISFGLDTPFLQEDLPLDSESATHVRENVAQLVALVRSIEKNCGISSRLLWSESGDSLAEKLIARLQQVN